MFEELEVDEKRLRKLEEKCNTLSNLQSRLALERHKEASKEALLKNEITLLKHKKS